MNDEQIYWATATELAEAIRTRRVSAVATVQAVLDRIDALDGKLGAFVTVVRGPALGSAVAADNAQARGVPLGPLHGVPVSLKDIIYTKGIRTTGGSFVFENFMPDADAIVVERLKAAGAIVIGKTATPEFCHKTVTDSPLLGTTRNPWHLGRTTAGSSGGSAAAVSAGFGPISIGTDGGGSIRLPAALCGVVGFKPSVGRVPQYPGFAGWDFLGHTGPFARCVEDIRLAMNVIGGPDARDPSSLQAPGGARPERELGQLRVAVARSLNHIEPEQDVALGLELATVAARTLGCRLSEKRISWTDPDLQFRVIVATELAAALGRYLPEYETRMDPGLVKMLCYGASQAGTDLVRALEWKRSFARNILNWFEDVDLLLVPTAPVTAFPAGIIGPTTISGRSTSPYDWFSWTWPFNLTGQPAISLPVWGSNRLPVGLQIVGRPGDDDIVLNFAAALESRLGSAGTQRHPPL
ncbi:MAG: aspartyl-tRNA(Asn)/glutamyl-tRNA(Gln) amidotransferase subunit [Alphaproteobacteria bacterium]|nr:aspartyl-tRNA(Asn)/glutamyl-tRNA(Gln) amidotransferase subunit [Alphaproteobacteria bacterium]